MKLAVLLSLVAGCAPAVTATPAQTPTPAPITRGAFTVGQPVERDVAAGGRHDHEIELKTGEFLLVVVDQRGVDVAVRVYDPDGEQVQQVDRSGAHGVEAVPMFSQQAGSYRIEIAAAKPDAAAGRYAVTIERLEAAAPDPVGRTDQLLSFWDHPDRPGAAIAVARDGAIVHKRGVGSAQLEYNAPIRPDTIFHVASVSKQFTAFAVILLAHQGKLSLDDDIRKHLPEVPDFGATITLRHLIHHTSGLRDQWSLLVLAGWRHDDVITQDDIMSVVRKQTELNFAPGTNFSYSNTGYTLLAEVVARVTGQSFRDWTADNLFKPLGMTRTHFHDDHEMIVPGRAYSYAPSSDRPGYQKSVLSYANVGATSLFTTVEDLARWADNLDTGAVGGGDVLAAMHKRAVLASGYEIDYASGLYYDQHRGLKHVGHGGADAGFRSSVLRFPDHRLSVVVLSNSASFPAGSMAPRIAAEYLADHVDKQPGGATSASGDAGVRVDGAVLDSYAGTYRLENGMVVTIKRERDRLIVEPEGMPAMVMVTQSETEFLVREFSATLKFEPTGAGPVDRLTFTRGGFVVPGARVKPRQSTAQELAAYAGVYFSPELEVFYSVKVRDGKLVAYHRRHGDIPLTAQEADVFSSDEWYFERVAFIRDSGAVTGMRVSNGRMRNVRFKRQADRAPTGS